MRFIPQPSSLTVLEDVANVAIGGATPLGDGRLVGLTETLTLDEQALHDNHALALNILGWLSGMPLWAVTSPSYGTVPAMDSVTIAVNVDAAGLGPGDYDGELEIVSGLTNGVIARVGLHMEAT